MASEVGTAEVGTAEVGTAEVGKAEVGTAEVGTAEVGTAEVGTAEVGTAEVGIAEFPRRGGIGGGQGLPHLPAPRIPFADSLLSPLEKLEEPRRGPCLRPVKWRLQRLRATANLLEAIPFGWTQARGQTRKPGPVPLERRWCKHCGGVTWHRREWTFSGSHRWAVIGCWPCPSCGGTIRGIHGARSAGKARAGETGFR